MKKIICVILAILCCVVCIGALAACGDETDEPDDDSDIYYIEYEGTKIKLCDKADGVLDALGTPKSVDELGDCGGFGSQVKYKYDNFNIYTLKNDKGETIDQISFTSDLVATSKGICLYASADEVLKKYGEPTKQDDTEMRYQKDNLLLKFELENGIVTEIDYFNISK